jgi:hypothetical protein
MGSHSGITKAKVKPFAREIVHGGYMPAKKKAAKKKKKH